ncbi:MAG: PAS domain-containing sensor histidine kinase [Planctomycetes bacterium]|nr:PAS domain-containing sensor histidine kinase [Planctomycetota bacterium]
MTACRSFIDSLDDQIVVVGRDYEVLMANAPFLEKAGLPEADVIGRHCHEVTRHSSKPCWAAGEGCPLAGVLQGGTTISVAHVHFDAAGNKRHVEVVGSPLRDADGHFIGMIESVREVPQAKQIEESLRKRNSDLEETRRKRDQFTSTVCHELKNVMNVLSLHAQMLRNGAAEPSQAHAGPIVDGLKRLARLVGDMQDAAEIECQRFSVRRGPCDLGAVVRQSAEEGQFASREHRITVEGPETSIDGEWDAGRLRQVLDNLVSNAIKYSPPGSEISILIRREAGRISVSVRDSGPGIASGHLRELFQPYARAHTKVPGLGLGLYLSRGIIEAHGGEIWAHSVEGRGSTFSFWLPA